MLGLVSSLLLLLFGGLSAATKVIPICYPDIGNYSFDSPTDQVKIVVSSLVGSYQCKLRIRVPPGFVALASSSAHYIRGDLRIYSPDYSLNWELRYQTDASNRPRQFRSDSRDIIFAYQHKSYFVGNSNWTFTVTAVSKNPACSCGATNLSVDGDSWSSPGLNLTSPAWPNYYPVNCGCQWTVSPGDPRRAVVAQIIAFRSIMDDTLSFREWPDGRLLGNCSHGTLYPTKDSQLCFPSRTIGSFTPGAALNVSFKSAPYHIAQGFLVNFITVDPGCGPTEIELKPRQRFTLRSPAYPLRYTPNINCTWTIRGPVGTDFIEMWPAKRAALFHPISQLKVYDGSGNLRESTDSGIRPITVKGMVMRIEFASGNYPSSFQNTFTLMFRADGVYETSTTAPVWKTTSAAILIPTKFNLTNATTQNFEQTSPERTSRSPSIAATSIPRSSPSVFLIVGILVGVFVLLLLALAGVFFSCGMIAGRRRVVAKRPEQPPAYDMAWRATTKQPSAPPKDPPVTKF